MDFIHMQSVSHLWNMMKLLQVLFMKSVEMKYLLHGKMEEHGLMDKQIHVSKAATAV